MGFCVKYERIIKVILSGAFVKKIVSFFILLSISSCSFIKSKTSVGRFIEVRTVPIKAEIVDSSGGVIGVTPLKIPHDKIEKIEKDNVVSFVIKKNGYRDKQVVFKSLGISQIEVKLDKYSDKEYKKMINGPMSSIVDQIMIDLINSQDRIIRKDHRTAKERIERLIASYPSLSTNYMLSAVVDINLKRYKQARALLEKSLNIDPTNQMARSYLNYVRKLIRKR